MSARTVVLPFLVLLLLPALSASAASRSATGAAATRPAPAAPTGVVNLNTATEAELRRLPGIGASKAARIVKERAKGKYASTDQIMRVKGIGRGIYRRLKPYLAVAGSTTLEHKVRPPARARLVCPGAEPETESGPRPGTETSSAAVVRPPAG